MAKEKINGKMKELATTDMAKALEETGVLTSEARKWIENRQERRHPRPDLSSDEFPVTR